ncbi:hypothetical protein HYH03_003621 [Edaphochlamys debaryana]|uniref:polynucleotide adenylyltransferase n=1 Tax=Edaphochlamys debaryana TaxID=47281 RepID=A0A835Y8R5_9CHLO|nr:hypothetical protein HYH03_003621 [Edaphochlamys debaryana]|eukprot:KAG2498362.1 hypothetical protein HYH03_003621 [Edaphochlamys debaryana]
MSTLDEVYLLRPLNTHEPTEQDRRHSQELEEHLRAAGLYESLDEAILREEVLGLLYQIVQDWVKGVARKKNFSVEDARAHVCTFGSYRLGVHGPGADMDTLVVGPRYVTRDTDFFGGEKHCLQFILTQTPDIADIQPVPDAFVPMLGIKYKGIQIDILYAPLAMHTLPETLDLSNHTVLRGCDEATVRSLNGCRVTDTLLKLVPRQDVFRLALRAAKHWASLRGISSNVTGYLGGVNLAIMVAKICQLYPKAEASTILVKFFILLKAWPWPRAIHLRVPEDYPMGLPVWDPRPGMRDSLALMPVITPAYPAMNSLYNVQKSTLEVMTAEFTAAAEVCTQFLHCREGERLDWSKLFTPVPFFATHTFYIQLEVSANHDSDLLLWDGWVSSRIRRLVRNLEDHVRVRPYPKAQKPPPPTPPPPSLLALTGADGAAGGAASAEGALVKVEPKEEPADGLQKEKAKAAAAAAERPRLMYYIGIDKRLAPTITAAQLLPNGQVAQNGPLHAPAAPAGKVDLKQPCTIFVNEVSAWPAKRPGMELRVNVLRRRDLPPWLTGGPLPEQLQAAGDAAAKALAAEAAPAAPQLAGVKRPAPEAQAGPGVKAETAAAGAAPAGAEARRPPPAKRPRAEAAAAGGTATRPPATKPLSSAAAAPKAPAQAPSAAAKAPAAAAADGRTSRSASGSPRELTPAPAPDASAGGTSTGGQPPLTAEAQVALQAQASVADDRAAAQEQQLASTARDMGDWLGVDHGVDLQRAKDDGGPHTR